MSRSYKTTLSLVTVVLANNKENQPIIFLDPNHSFPIICFSKRTLSETMPLLFQAYGIPDITTNTTIEGILAVHSDHAHGFHQFTFVVYCRVNKVVESDMKIFFPLDEAILEAMPKQSHHLPASVTLTCVNFLCNLQTKWPSLKITEFLGSLTNSYPSQVRLDLVVFVVVIQEGKILLIKETPRKGGGWFLPAGHIEAGEDVVTAAKRETREESGFQVSIEGVIRIVYTWGRYSPLHFVLKGKIVGGVIKKEQDEESDEAEWVDLGTVRREVREQINIGGPGKYRSVGEMDGILSVIVDDNGVDGVVIPLLT